MLKEEKLLNSEDIGDEGQDVEGVEKQEVVLTEEQKEEVKTVVDYLEMGQLDFAIEFLKKYSLSYEIIQFKEIQEVAIKQIIFSLKIGKIDSVMKIKKEFFVSDKIMMSKEIQEAAIKLVNNCLYNYLEIDFPRENYLGKAKVITNKFLILDNVVFTNDVIKKAEEKILELFKNGNLGRVGEIKRGMHISDDFFMSDRIQQAIKNYLITNLETGEWLDPIEKIEDLDLVSEEFIQSDEIIQAAINGIAKELESGRNDNAMKIKEKFNISSEIILKFFSQKIAENDIKNIYVIQKEIPECQPLYQEFLNKQKQIAQDPNLSHQEKQKSFEALAGLAENGEDSITKEFVEIIQKRGKEKGQSEQTEISESGFDNVQDGAYNTLLLLDNSDSNEALFGLLDNESINRDVKFATLEKLVDEDRDFLDRSGRLSLRKWLSSKSLEKLDWQDMKFIKAIQNDIPSAELKKKSEKIMSEMIYYYNLAENKKSINQIWQKDYPNIPENIFLQSWKFTEGDKELMNKFQVLYSSLKKEGTKKENLLYGIVNSLDSDSNILELLVDKLKEVDFSNKEDADCLSEVLRNTVFLDKIDEIINHGDYDEYDNYDEKEDYDAEQENTLDSEIKKIFSKDVNNLEELQKLLKEVATRKIQEVLPNENITAEKIENVEKEWGNLEPIFTYLGRYSNLKKYIAEMVVNFDDEKNWKEWRYNLENKTVKKQVGHLSEEQLEVWKEEYFAEVGDIMIAERGSDIPREIQNILEYAVITHKHIFNPEMEMNENEFIQKIFEKVYDEIEENPEKKDEITEDEINKIKTSSKQIDTIINFNDLPRVKESLKTTFALDAEIKMSKKVKNLIGFMAPYLSKELFEIIKENCEKVENKDEIKVSDEKSDDEDKIKVDEILPIEIRKALEENINETEKEFENLQDSDIWEKLQLDKNNLKNLKQFHQKRKELKSTIDLLRLNNLSNKLIVTNRIVEKEGKKRRRKIN